jgi:hypothetical protein
MLRNEDVTKSRVSNIDDVTVERADPERTIALGPENKRKRTEWYTCDNIILRIYSRDVII